MPSSHAESDAGSTERLALFPLPSVLLPGATIPLHIFEERYRALIADALEGDRRFGLLYHDWDRQGPFMNSPGHVGCVARIREHEMLDDGRSLVLIEGVARFTIVEGLEQERLYFEAIVGAYRDRRGPPDPDLHVRRERSLRLFHAVVASLEEAPERLPTLSVERELSFSLAQTIAVDPSWHHQLLELRDERERLDRVDVVMRAALG